MHYTYLLKILGPAIPFVFMLSGFPISAKTERVPSPGRAPAPFTISEVTIDRRVIHPFRGERVTISYTVSRPAKAIVKIFDPEMHLVRELVGESAGDSGRHRVVWDGKDLQGMIVPAEAYFFTVEASDLHGDFTFYDPTVVSGGEPFFPESVRFDRGKGVISYHLIKDSRVNIRAGVSRGPLLKSILNWSPRLAAYHEETWDGKDESGVIEVLSQRDSRLTVEAVGLPENSIIVRGNTHYDFFTYRNNIAPDRPRKVERPRFRGETEGLGLHSGMPDRIGPEPKFRLILPKSTRRTEEGLPLAAGKTPIRVLLDEKIKRYVTEERYEIVFFVDFGFVTEMEEGYSPITFLWDTRSVDNGEHVITVNVVTLTGRLSSNSLRVVVQN